MSQELEQMENEQKDLIGTVKKLEMEFSNSKKEVIALEEKQVKLSEQVITEQIKTRMQIDEIKDDNDEMEKNLNKLKEVF